MAVQPIAAEEIAPAWAGTPVSFALLVREGRRFAAFFDADRRLTVGERGGDGWTLHRLPERVGWDAHHDLELAADREGHLHLAGNMHGDPLTYFRTAEPLDAATFGRVDEMVGRREDSVTYPSFIEGPDGDLVFAYRDGRSGAGERLFNVYDPGSREWRRLLDEPLLSGGDAMNAYPRGPVAGPDGRYHLCWVWRDTPDAATNHDVCYARSPDLRRWETSAGDPLDLPITAGSAEVVDPVPPGGGLINGNTEIGFDREGRVVVSYHKHDGDGYTQIYNARRESGGWTIRRASDWEYRWEFGGGGSIPFEIDLSGVATGEDGLVQTYDHAEYGPGKWVLDPDTLRPVEHRNPWHRYPEGLREPGDPRMQVNWVEEGGHALRWETLPPNRDRPREEAPPPAALWWYEFAGE